MATANGEIDLPVFPVLVQYGKVLGFDAYAEEKHEEDLEAALERFDNFFVTDALKRDHLKMVAHGLVPASSSGGYTIVHRFAVLRQDEKGIEMLKKLLSLGINPDVSDYVRFTGQGILSFGCRPSHTCAAKGNWRVAEMLVLCRPDLCTTSFMTGLTPESAARENRFKLPNNVCIKLASIWEKAAKQGFPSIAQLAKEKEFWAVQNLVRRGIVPDSEKLQHFDGKTALQWVEFHGEFGLAEELWFLLDLPDKPSSRTAMQQAAQSGSEELKEILAVTVSKLNEENEKLQEQLQSLHQKLGVFETNTGKLEDRVKKMEHKKNHLEKQVEDLKAQQQQKEESMKKEMESMKAVWQKQQDAWQEQFKAMQAQMAIMPSVISSSVSAAVAAFHPPAEKRARLSDL